MLEKAKSPTFIASLILVGLIFFIAQIDTDFGWHLRYGQHLIDTKSFLRTNELTYLMPGYLWPNSYTLYQFFITVIYNTLGFTGLSIAYSLFMMATFVIFDSINPKYTKINLFLFLLTMIFGWIVFYLGFRSQIFTFSGLILLFYLIKYYKTNIKLIIFIPILFVFWVNLHGGFILGIILLAISALESLVKKKLNEFKILSISTVLAVFFSLINPYGVKVYEEALRHMTVPMHALIAEWLPPRPVYSFIVVISAGVIISMYWIRKNDIKVFWSLVLIVFSFLALKARRSLSLFGLFLSLSLFDLFPKELEKIERSQITQTIFNVSLLVAIPFFLVTSVPKNNKLNVDWETYCTKGMLPQPCETIDYIKNNPPEGENVYSHYEWGGFLAWQLPEYKFFVDGRTPAWPTPEGKSPYTIYLEIIQAREGYQEQLDLYNTNWLLIGNGTFLDIELQENENTPWREIYRNDMTAIYIKK